MPPIFNSTVVGESIDCLCVIGIQVYVCIFVLLVVYLSFSHIILFGGLGIQCCYILFGVFIFFCELLRSFILILNVDYNVHHETEFK